MKKKLLKIIEKIKTNIFKVKGIFNIEKYNNFIILLSIILSVLGLYISYKSLYIAIPEYKEFIENSKIPNINGNWEFDFITEKSNLKKYIGMKDKYDIFLIGNKNIYKGKGEKYESYGNFINPKNRAKIEFDIIIKDNKMYGFFVLYGSREVSGNIIAKLNKEGNKFVGNFTTSAANSKGQIIGILK